MFHWFLRTICWDIAFRMVFKLYWDFQLKVIFISNQTPTLCFSSCSIEKSSNLEIRTHVWMWLVPNPNPFRVFVNMVIVSAIEIDFVVDWNYFKVLTYILKNREIISKYTLTFENNLRCLWWSRLRFYCIHFEFQPSSCWTFDCPGIVSKSPVVMKPSLQNELKSVKDFVCKYYGGIQYLTI